MSAQAVPTSGHPFPFPFPDKIDNTMRGDFVQCPHRFFRSFIQKLGGTTPNIHLHAGGAFARALEVCRRSFEENQKTIPEAMRDGLEALIEFYGPFEAPATKTGDKSLDNVIRAYDSYFRRYPLDKDPIKTFRRPDGKLAIEFTFAIPTEVRRPTCGHCGYSNFHDLEKCEACGQPLDPILYSGRADRLGYLYDSLLVVDEKTTTSLGESWANQWDLESQFTGYVAAGRYHGWPVAGGLIRGVGLLKTKISHAEAQVSRGPWVIERWWRQLNRDLQRMVRCYLSWRQTGDIADWDYAISKTACYSFGECTFALLCGSPEPDKYIPIHYRHRDWDPLAKDRGMRILESDEWKKQASSDEIIVRFE